MVKEVMQNTYDEGFIEFMLREKKEEVEEVISFFIEGYEVNEYENRYIESTINNNEQNKVMTDYVEGIAQNDFIEEENQNKDENEGKVSFAKMMSNHEEYFDLLF